MDLETWNMDLETWNLELETWNNKKGKLKIASAVLQP